MVNIKFEMEAICRMLSGCRGVWALTGSAALMLRGCDIYPNDIDIIASKRFCHYVSKNYSEYLTQEFSLSERYGYKSYFGKIKLHGYDVEIMASVYNLNKSGVWIKNSIWSKNIENILLNGNKIPCLSLKHELDIAIIRGDYIKIDTLNRCFNIDTK